ncbi:MAG TPA: CDP-alcohol phosphatidyltransferase family protein, partial [Geminicoccaceae bacterium]|nr:CDP-alcohol phosphatidyltransferase family protein [Geminicoccaceae bacterium]
PQPRHAVRGNVDVVLSRSRLNLANLITGGRLLAVLPAVWLIGAGRIEAAFWLFLAAGASDAIDGFIAKRFNARTDLGAYLDPIADKVLLTGVYLALAAEGYLAAWLVALVVSRDLLIVAGVVLLHRRDPLFRARPLLIGKANTLAQIVLAVAVLADAGGLLGLGGMVAAWTYIVAATTLLSGGAYAAQVVMRSGGGGGPTAAAAGEGPS